MAPPEYDFGGTWFDVEATMVVIQDNIMCGNEGQCIDLHSTGPTCSFKSGDEIYRGKLTDPDHIMWDDGEEWVRSGALNAPPVTEKEAANEDLLKQKIAAFLRRRSDAEPARPRPTTRRFDPPERLERPARASEEGRAMATPERHAPSLGAGSPAFEESKSRSQAGVDRARQAFEAEKARKAAALERARASKAQQSQAGEEGPPEYTAASRARSAQEMQGATPASREAASPQPSGMDRARQAFEKDKARKAAALERARSSGKAADDCTESGISVAEFEEAKARSEAGIDRARKAFEDEKARKAAALQRARAKASASVADSEPGGSPRGTGQGQGVQRTPMAPAPAGKGSGLGMRAPDLWRQDPKQEEYSPGKHVKIVGLGSQPELNGQIATLIKFIEDKGRWQARIPGRPSILIKTENMEQATAEEKAQAGAAAARSPAPPLARGGKGKGGGKDPLPQCVVSMGPGEYGNQFDVKLCEEQSIEGAMEKLVSALAFRGVCTCEANAPVELINSAYDEATALWNAGEFGPPCAYMEGQPEEKIWQDVLYQSEDKAFWIREDLKGPRRMDCLKVLSQNIWDLCLVLAEELLHQMGITYTHYWSAMLSCYHGDKTYNLHLDNPNGADESGIPDNGLRLSLCYYLNPLWEPGNSPVTNCGGGLDIHLTEPWETPSSLLVARKAPVMRIAPHADTLVMFLSQKMAHRVVATHGSQKWFALWVYCYDEQVKNNFDVAAGDLVKDVF